MVYTLPENIRDRIGTLYAIFSCAIFVVIADPQNRQISYLHSPHFDHVFLNPDERAFKDSVELYLEGWPENGNRLRRTWVWHREGTPSLVGISESESIAPSDLERRLNSIEQNLLAEPNVNVIFYCLRRDLSDPQKDTKQFFSLPDHKKLTDSEAWQGVFNIEKIVDYQAFPCKPPPVNRPFKRARTGRYQIAVWGRARNSGGGDSFDFGDNGADSFEQTLSPGSAEWFYWNRGISRRWIVRPTVVSKSSSHLIVAWPDVGFDDHKGFFLRDVPVLTHRHCEDGGAPSLRCECAHFQLDPDHPTCTHVKCLQAFPREFDNALETPDGPTALPDGKGTTVAFYTRGAIVRQLGTGLSCSVDAHKHCRCVHVKDVEQAFGPSLQAAASDDTDDAARMIKEMVKDHPGLPMGLTLDPAYNYKKGIWALAKDYQSILYNQSVGGNGGLAPLLQECPCGHCYSIDDYKVVCSCDVYLDFPHGLKKTMRYRLQCPNPDCKLTVEYDGALDGLFAVSNDTFVTLHSLYKCVSSFNKSGYSPTTFHSDMADDYKFIASMLDPEDPSTKMRFLSVKTWRKAVYLFAYCLNTEIKLQCPCCGTCPSTVIVDATFIPLKREKHSGHCVSDATSTVRVPCGQCDRAKRAFLPTADARSRLSLIGDAVHNRSDIFVPVEVACQPGDIGPFLTWAGSLVDDADMHVVGTFITKCLATTSPVLSYLDYEVYRELETNVGHGTVSLTTLLRMQERSPLLFGVLEVAGAHCGADFPIPNALIGLFSTLCARCAVCFQGDPFNMESLRLPEEESMSPVLDESLEVGMISGMPRIRHLPEFDANSDPSSQCRHQFTTGRDLTGGVMTVSCRHGVCYAAFIIRGAEGRKHIFSYIVQHFDVAPKVIVYDFACALQEYCLNRLPDFFKETLFVIDSFHWRNHTSCSRGYAPNAYKFLADVNTEVAEQTNSALRRIERTLTRSSQGSFMLLLRLFVGWWNDNKIKGLAAKHVVLQQLRAF